MEADNVKSFKRQPLTPREAAECLGGVDSDGIREACKVGRLVCHMEHEGGGIAPLRYFLPYELFWDEVTKQPERLRQDILEILRAKRRAYPSAQRNRGHAPVRAKAVNEAGWLTAAEAGRRIGDRSASRITYACNRGLGGLVCRLWAVGPASEIWQVQESTLPGDILAFKEEVREAQQRETPMLPRPVVQGRERFQPAAPLQERRRPEGSVAQLLAEFTHVKDGYGMRMTELEVAPILAAVVRGELAPLEAKLDRLLALWEPST